ncbi:MAG: hypothetical protein DWQ07_25275 [Chloroflexi bacterium]|nr:MAG: hypothetical protein DWQ07_25275 [Chloroflexota bacterium]MBL1196152.1 hypothetical protein [Chloroflexota bacterium]NOH13445.1 hypothetical protein [Chloroflexota bacterium]
MKHTIIILLLASVLMGACATGSTPYPDEVSWDVAVEILNRGEVEQAFQLHSLEVTLYLKDGTEVRTKEPVIDAIFDEIDKCGAVCADVLLATE